jgi:hypothetical protein
MKATDWTFLAGAIVFLTISFLALDAGAQCINNAYPGNNTFCLTFQEPVRTLNCGAGFTSVCPGTHFGPFGKPDPNPGLHQVVTLALTCNADQPKASHHWSLTCLSDGSLCNINDKEFCCGKSTFNVGDHCTNP